MSRGSVPECRADVALTGAVRAWVGLGPGKRTPALPGCTGGGLAVAGEMESAGAWGVLLSGARLPEGRHRPAFKRRPRFLTPSLGAFGSSITLTIGPPSPHLAAAAGHPGPCQPGCPSDAPMGARAGLRVHGYVGGSFWLFSWCFRSWERSLKTQGCPRGPASCTARAHLRWRCCPPELFVTSLSLLKVACR